MEKKEITNLNVEMVGNGYILTYKYKVERNGVIDIFTQKFAFEGKESLLTNIKSILGIK
jgi:hypothetical protein